MRPAGRLAEANIPATTLLSGPAEAEHHLGDAPHLDLFRPFRNPVTPVVPVDVLEGHMPRVADAAVHLDRLVRRVTDQPVRAVVAHRHLVADLHVVLMVQLPGGLPHELAHHLALGLQLHQRPLDGLTTRQRLPECDTLPRVLHRLVDTVLRRADARSGLTDAVLMRERVGECQAVPFASQHRVRCYAHVGQRDLGMVGRHVERPPHEVHRESVGLRRHDKATNALRPAFIAGSPRKNHVVSRAVHAAIEALLTVDQPIVAVADRLGLQPRGVRAMIGLGQPEGDSSLACEHALEKFLLLLLAPIALPHFDGGKVADDRGFILQVVVQSQPLRREMLADDCHRKVRAVAATVLAGDAVSQEAGFIRAAAHLRQEVLPLLAWHAAVLEIRPLVLAAVIEETEVVILLLQRLDLRLDKVIEVLQQRLDVLWDLEVHQATPYSASFGLATRTLFTIVSQRGGNSRASASPSHAPLRICSTNSAFRSPSRTARAACSFGISSAPSSRSNPAHSARMNPSSSSSSRLMMPMEFAATWNWKRSQRARAFSARSGMKPPNASSSSTAVGLSCTSSPSRQRARQPQDLELRLRRSPSDRRQFVALRMPIEMSACLHHRDLGPADVLEHFPGGHALAADLEAAGDLTGADPFLPRRDAAGLEIVFSESPDASTQPRDVFLRLADVCALPVQERRQSILVVHHVPNA